MSDLETRTRSALQQFDNNMAGIFDRSTFYDGDLYSTKSSDPSLNRSQKCFKYTLLFANLLFLIFGIVLMSVGSYAMNNTLAFVQGQTLPAGLIVLGVFIMLLSLLGALAAWKESRGFLGLYFALLLVITIILFAVGIAVYVQQDKLSGYIHDGYIAAYNADTKNSSSLILTAQSAFQCCGLDRISDDYSIPFHNCTGYTQPCYQPVQNYVASGLNTAGACGIAFAVIMLTGMVFVAVLMKGIKRKKLETDLAALRQSNNVSDVELGYNNENVL